MNNDYIFETRLEVRDYECDIEGIVNNANYLHYTEHTRHRFLKACGLSFAEMHEQGTDAVVVRMNLEYKAPLRCDDIIVSRLRLESRASATSSSTTSSGRPTESYASVDAWNWSRSSMAGSP